MARDDAACPDSAGELCGLFAVQVPGNTPFGTIPIDRQESQVYSEWLKRVDQSVVPKSVAAVINCQVAPLNHIT